MIYIDVPRTDEWYSTIHRIAIRFRIEIAVNRQVASHVIQKLNGNKEFSVLGPELIVIDDFTTVTEYPSGCICIDYEDEQVRLPSGRMVKLRYFIEEFSELKSPKI